MNRFRLPGVLALAGTLLFATSLSSQAPESVAAEDPPVLLVKPKGVYLDLPEQGADLTALLLGGGDIKPKSFYEMLERLEAAAEAPSTHVLFDLTAGFRLNAPQLAEVDRAIQKIRKSGKKTWAYLEAADTSIYQLAALCDRVLMADLGVLELGSPALSVTFMKDALDLLGVHMDVVRCGDFKGAVEPFMLPRMSDHLRSHYIAMLDRINGSIVERIVRGRNMSTAEVRDAQAKRLFTARAALEAGFVDQLVPWIGAKDAFEKVTKQDDLEFENQLEADKESKNINIMQLLSQLVNPRKDRDEVEEETVVVLHLSGGIVDGTKAQPGSIVSGPSVETIRELTANDNVKGVVVRINSPGGSATASEAILLALRDLSEKKPVVISMGTLAASGGYYISCIGRPILAEESTITGSIGVFGMKPSLGALMRRVGIHDELVALDASASMGSISEPWSGQQKERVQAFVNQIYDVFVGHVARSRGMTTGDVLAIAGGRVWSGGQAVENGLVDRIGGLHDALAMVVEEAGVGEGYEVKHMPRPKSFLEALFADGMISAEALFPDPRIRILARRTNLDRALRVILDGLTSDRPTTAWAMMPEAFRIR